MSRHRLRPTVRRVLRNLPWYDWRNFLLRDDFTTAESAPLASPRTAEPGPGTLTLVQTDGKFSTSSGKLNFPAQTTPVWGDQGFYGTSLTRLAGRALLVLVNKGQTNKESIPLGWSTTAVANYTGLDGINGVDMGPSSGNIVLTSATVGINVGVYSASTNYYFAIALRSAGAFVFIKGGAFTSWTLLWVDVVGVSSPLYPVSANKDASGTLDLFRVLDLPAPFNDDYGLATQRLAGARTAGDTFTHAANCVIEFIGTTMTGSAASLIFRWQDADNYWLLNVSNANIALYEVVAGSPTYRADASVTVSNGHRIVIVADGTTIRVYSNNVLRFTYSSASNFVTETDGRLATDGGGVISDIISWPRVLGSTAAALLDAAVA